MNEFQNEYGLQCYFEAEERPDCIRVTYTMHGHEKIGANIGYASAIYSTGDPVTFLADNTKGILTVIMGGNLELAGHKITMSKGNVPTLFVNDKIRKPEFKGEALAPSGETHTYMAHKTKTLNTEIVYSEKSLRLLVSPR